jgi:hypothetical protein
MTENGRLNPNTGTSSSGLWPEEISALLKACGNAFEQCKSEVRLNLAEERIDLSPLHEAKPLIAEGKVFPLFRPVTCQ